ncbi:hypothetical protein J4409_00370 [Candidatus Woesearchaeota archaeon]|nr:hypothetical protein [Candidatus Woesearchaeota archaeon]
MTDLENSVVAAGVQNNSKPVDKSEVEGLEGYIREQKMRSWVMCGLWISSFVFGAYYTYSIVNYSEFKDNIDKTLTIVHGLTPAIVGSYMLYCSYLGRNFIRQAHSKIDEIKK